MSGPDTKATILDAAEALFAEQGYVGTSLRQLTTMARVNLAAVHYHFGSKEDLAKAVLARRIEPINAERLQRLGRLRGTPPIEAIVRAFVEPPLRSTSVSPTGVQEATGQGFCRVFGRISVEQPPFLREFLGEQFRVVARRFAGAMQKAMPGHGTATLWWRLHFLIGSMAHTLQNSGALALLSDNRCDPNDVDEVVEQLVAFAVGGLGAAKRRPQKRRQSSRQSSRATSRATSRMSTKTPDRRQRTR